MTKLQDDRLVRTGVPGLDAVLAGGLPRRRMYMVQGDAGTGKTTLALQILLEGQRAGERGLYVTLSESRDELHAIASSHGWSLDDVAIFELSAADGNFDDDENTLYVPAEIELGERIGALLDEVDRVQPARVIIDSCSELRLLAQSPLRFRRQVLALKEAFARRGCTVILLDNPSSESGNELLQSLVHGVIHLEQLWPLYGSERRRLRIGKLREVAFRGGYHDISLRRAGISVFPRLVAAEHHGQFERDVMASGIAGLDAMLGGGLERGTSTLVLGPSGSGKSSLALQYACAAAERGERAAVFSFDENLGTLLARSSGLGLDVPPLIERDLLAVQQVDPAELSPGEFTDLVRREVEQRAARVLVIDSLNGYIQAMPEEQFLLVQLHELLSYLRQQGVLSLMVVVQHGFTEAIASIDVSYLADTVVATQYVARKGRLRKAISVVKKRAGQHEDSMRELRLSSRGLEVGAVIAVDRGAAFESVQDGAGD